MFFVVGDLFTALIPTRVSQPTRDKFQRDLNATFSFTVTGVTFLNVLQLHQLMVRGGGAGRSVEYLSLFPSGLFTYSRVTGAYSLTDEVSLSEQLLQVIDDLIRMLPAARRLTLKDFPICKATNRQRSPRLVLCARQHLFLTASQSANSAAVEFLWVSRGFLTANCDLSGWRRTSRKLPRFPRPTCTVIELVITS